MKLYSRVLILAAAIALTGACAGAPEREAGPEAPANLEQPGSSSQVRVERRLAGAGQMVGLGVKSFFVDPLVRPVSNQISFYSVVLKSATGLGRRLAIDTIQFPFLESRPIPPVQAARGMDPEAWERRLDRLTGRPASRGRLEFLIDGDEYFPRLMAAFEEAEYAIDIRTYIFDNDDYATLVADRLKARSREVRVNVLMDGLGQLLASQTDPDMMPAGHVPPHSIAAYLRDGSRIKVRSQANPWLTGDHVKTTIIDGRLAFVGGMNVGREYRYDWHDMMAAVRGPVVAELKREFELAWWRSSHLGDAAWLAMAAAEAPDAPAESEGDYPIRVLATRNHDSEIYRAQLAAIRRARQRIFIENAYFSDDLILYELARARRRGVDVRVIVPSAGNHESMNRSNDVAINVMLENGIRVYRYPGMSHMKVAVYDGWACLGSANFDKMSLQINKELNLATSHPEAVETLVARVFEQDFALSTELTTPPDLTAANHVAEFFADELL